MKHTHPLTNRPQFFFDPAVVATTVNVARAVTRPVKHPGNPPLRCEFPWEEVRMDTAGVLWLPDEGHFRMYYTGWPERKNRRATVLACAESTDGCAWHKPMWDRCRWPGHDRTNILQTDPGGMTWLIPILDERDVARPYRAVLKRVKPPDSGPEEPGGLHVSDSADGLTWTKPRLVSATKCDTFPNLVYFPPLDRYFIYTRAQAFHPSLPNAHLRVTGVLESDDFEHWSEKRAINLLDESLGWPFRQVHGLITHACGDLLLGLAAVMALEDRDENFLARFDTRLAMSRDGWHWDLIADEPFLEGGPSAWDLHFVHPTSMAVRGDTAYVYYNGYPLMHGELRRAREQDYPLPEPPHPHNMGVATLPADRFVAITPRDPGRTAILETPPVTFEGSELLLNADAAPEALAVELVDEQSPTVQYQSAVFDGFDREHCVVRRHDALRYRVTWRDGAGERPIGAAAPGRPLVLRFILRAGSLFTFTIRDA